MRHLISLSLAALLAASTTAPALAQSDEKLTGIDRARAATMQAVENANDRAAEARGELPPGLAKQAKDGKLTGRDRAAASVAKALERGNGNGNAHGRGHSADVLAKLLNGESPATLEGQPNHGAKVSAMVKAFNELKKQARADR